MVSTDKELFESIFDTEDQEKIDHFLRETNEHLTDWLSPTEKDYDKVSWAYQIIIRVHNEVDTAIKVYNNAVEKADEAAKQVITELKEDEKKGKKLTLEDFNENNEHYMAYLDALYNKTIADWKKNWSDTFTKYLQSEKDPYTGELIRLQ